MIMHSSSKKIKSRSKSTKKNNTLPKKWLNKRLVCSKLAIKNIRITSKLKKIWVTSNPLSKKILISVKRRYDKNQVRAKSKESVIRHADSQHVLEPALHEGQILRLE
jgi:hypothetical protein